MISDNKILVVVLVPTINSEYNAFIPIGKTIGFVKNQFIKAIQEQYDEILLDNANLYDKETSIILEEHLLIKDTNIKNGTKLLLI